MRRKLILLTSFVLVMGLVLTRAADGALPRLIGWWRFDGDTLDYSGLGNDGTAAGNPTFVPGKVGSGAIELDGKSDYVAMNAVADDIKSNNITLCAWLKTSSDRNTEWFSCNTAGRDDVIKFCIQSNKAAFRIEAVYAPSTTAVNDGQWHFLALVLDGLAGHVYIDGVEENSDAADPTFSADDLWSIGQEWDSGGPGAHLAGTVDDARIYDRALTAEEVRKVMMGIPPGAAFDPGPADETTDVPRDVAFSWMPGEYASLVDGHKFYLSDNFNDVNDGIGGITQSATSYAPAQRLDFGTTYYWRVDEVNSPPDYTVYEGKVWSFTTELFAYPIENVAATASSASQAKMGPENTINGSGLDDNDLHSNKEMDIWLSGTESLGAWIEYEFDKVYNLHEMWVWNSNQTVESLLGFGVKDVTVDYSTNGTDYTTLGTTHEFARAPGASGYAHNTTIDFSGIRAKYVRLTATSNWGGIMPQYGLSEVRFFQIPVSARKPYPDSGATGVDVDVVLGWTAGREAAKHDVYFSADEQAVIDGTAPVATVTETSHGPLALDLDTTHYWKVIEVNEAETPSTWESAIWSFTTTDHLIVDDFESYNDLNPENPESNRIFNAWIDGYEVPTNGSLVGNENPPFCERTIVHGGKQSMPFFYSNTGGAAYSEAELSLSPPQNWTEAGAAIFVLYFHGAEGNTGQLYVKIDGSKVVYDGEAGGIAKVEWKQWNIDLASLGVNLQNVTKLAIGIDGNGAGGTLYVDDIGLYASAP
ncbi:MAG TPA: LamG-like jellyroll fold domain-containing protein [Sedimentisphaerales bacterium]|nr:LamG-like jellyroll fold domain-containing protein [Sedimentisphaerales bacterium]